MSLVTVSSPVVAEGSEKFLTAEDTIRLVERNLISLFGFSWRMIWLTEQLPTNPIKKKEIVHLKLT
jgi:hypothetical protein